MGRSGPYYTDLTMEWEVFLDEREATHFRDSLVAAFKLLRITSNDNVTLRKRT